MAQRGGSHCLRQMTYILSVVIAAKESESSQHVLDPLNLSQIFTYIWEH